MCLISGLFGEAKVMILSVFFFNYSLSYSFFLEGEVGGRGRSEERRQVYKMNKEWEA